ncbi:zinc knuckle CX2CX4HX4C containing protein [Tanacetum coccineum]
MSKILRTFCSVSSQSVLQEQVIHVSSKSANLVATKDKPSFDVNAQHVQVSSTGMFGPIPSKSIGRFGNTSSIATESNVDVAATFGVSLSTVGDLEVASLPGESDGTRNVSSDSVTVHTSSPVEEVLIHSIDDITALFGLSLNFLKDINEFTKDLEVGKNALWLELASTSYAGAAGASSEDQPKVNSNFHPLVVDLVFDCVNISIPRKFIEKEQLDCLMKLTRIPIWVKLHDVPIQVFEEDGISLIATFIGRPVMLDSYTSSMCNDLWDRSSFARRLIEVNLEADLVDVVTISIPSLTGDGFTKETIRDESSYCYYFYVVTPTIEKSHDGLQTVGRKKKRKGKSKSTNVGQFASPSVKQSVRYEPKVTTSAPTKGTTNVGNASTSSSMLKTTGTSSKKYNISTSNSFSALNDDEEDEDEGVENVYDESANLFSNTKIDRNSSFTAAVA